MVIHSAVQAKRSRLSSPRRLRKECRLACKQYPSIESFVALHVFLCTSSGAKQFDRPVYHPITHYRSNGYRETCSQPHALVRLCIDPPVALHHVNRIKASPPLSSASYLSLNSADARIAPSERQSGDEMIRFKLLLRQRPGLVSMTTKLTSLDSVL
jgi:hypothetical protein